MTYWWIWGEFTNPTNGQWGRWAWGPHVTEEEAHAQAKKIVGGYYEVHPLDTRDPRRAKAELKAIDAGRTGDIPYALQPARHQQ